MSLARIGERQDRPHTGSQLSSIDQASYLGQVLTGDLDQKERGRDRRWEPGNVASR